jgi:hypothetical protein
MPKKLELVGRLVRLYDQDGVHYGYGHWCPGCNNYHPFFRTQRTTHTHQSAPVWGFDGNEMKPTFTPSMRVYTPEHEYKDDTGTVHKFPEATRCHYHLVKGRINYCADSPHKLRGVQGVELPEIETDGEYVWLRGRENPYKKTT